MGFRGQFRAARRPIRVVSLRPTHPTSPSTRPRISIPHPFQTIPIALIPIMPMTIVSEINYTPIISYFPNVSQVLDHFR